MEKKSIYVVHDQNVEDTIYYNDLEGFREIVEDESKIDHEDFETEEEADAFVLALYLGIDERSSAGFAVLDSTIESDIPFINIIKEL